MFPSVCREYMADGRKQIERSEDAEGAAIIKVDTDLDLDFEDNKLIPLSRMEGRDLRVYFPKKRELGLAEDFGYICQGGELRKMTEEERAKQNRRGQRTCRSGESLTGRQPESKSRWRSATQSTRDRSPSRQRSAVRAHMMDHKVGGGPPYLLLAIALQAGEELLQESLSRRSLARGGTQWSGRKGISGSV